MDPVDAIKTVRTFFVQLFKLYSFAADVIPKFRRLISFAVCASLARVGYTTVGAPKLCQKLK